MQTTDTHLLRLCDQLATELKVRRWMMSTAESCTGGLIAASCTGLSGSSDWFERGFVSYSNAAKTELLGVPTDVIARHGAVSPEVAGAMALGALAHSRAQVSVAVTGIAGPTGGSADKPVGLVWFGWAVGRQLWTECLCFDGDRDTVRTETVWHALSGLMRHMPQD